VRVSDFVYPQYFETFWHKGATKFDHLGHLSGPLPSLTHGGYMSYLDFTSGQWKQITARLDDGNSAHRNDSPVLVKALYRERPHVGARGCPTLSPGPPSIHLARVHGGQHLASILAAGPARRLSGRAGHGESRLMPSA